MHIMKNKTHKFALNLDHFTQPEAHLIQSTKLKDQVNPVINLLSLQRIQ